MDKPLTKVLRRKNAKLLIVDQEVEKNIKSLMERFNTSALDVVGAATKLLSQAAGKKIILRDPDSNYDIVIDCTQSLIDEKTKK